MTKIYTCPQCYIELGLFPSGNHQTIQCHFCRGVFLPEDQMQNQFKRNAIVFDVAPPTSEQKRKCPTDGTGMNEKRISDGENTVVIDQCPTCNGVWFDPGEIKMASNILKKNFGRLSYRKHAQFVLLKAEQDAIKFNKPPKVLEPLWWFSVITSLPVEGYNKVFQTPVVTVTLISLCSLGLLGKFLFPEEFMVFALSSSTVYEHPFQLVTSFFMHADFLHLLGNLYFLKIFGDNVEDRLGRFMFLVFYLFCGIFSGMTYVNFGFDGSVMVGASGAISGILGAYVVFFPKVKIFLIPNVFSQFRLIPFTVAVYIPIWFLWQYLMSIFILEQIAWSAHFGGLIGGVTLAFFMHLLLPDARIEFLRNQSLQQ